MKKAGLVSICLALLVATGLAASATVYTIRDLGVLSGTDSSEAKGVNDRGEVVGLAQDAQGHYHAFYWSASRGMVELEALSGDRDCMARAINNSGLIAGASGVGGLDYRLFLRTIDAGLVATGPRYTDARAINEQGQTAGKSKMNAAGIRDTDGTMVDLGSGLAYGINGLGQAVGYRYDSGAGTNVAIYWAGPGSSFELGQGVACDINDSGQIVGYGSNSALVWDRVGNVSTLPTLPGHPNASAASINNAGQIVGSLHGLAVLWNPDNSVMALDPLPGGSLTYARSISENGLIAGKAKDASGIFHAVLWEPVPEPSSALVLSGCSIAFARLALKTRRS